MNMHYALCTCQVRPVGEDEVFKVMKSGKRQKKAWKRQAPAPP